ncbi:gliding motility lipoprotein GldD [Bacteroidia bacterium]|jgi:gliding motility-associated lipoprotein GldD|nr:gliding motility lipoprotein GldD [Bacteroidia bacterium]
MSKLFSYILGCCFLMVGCTDYIPKPKAYPRIYYPERNFTEIDTDCPFSFEIPNYSKLVPYAQDHEPCWYNLMYPQFNATLHLSYIEIKSTADLDSLTEDAYKMVFKPHLQRAEEIIEREISDTAKGFSGLIYDLQGKTATPLNFYITDNKKHFFRGSFYFNTRTSQDSVMPIYNFINEDIMRCIRTFEFKL